MLNRKLLINLIFVFLFCLTAGIGYSQSIRYISYYPIPSATHSQLNVGKKAVLGAANNATVEFGNPASPSGLVASKFEAGRVAVTSFNDAGGNTDLVVGSTSSKDTVNTGKLKAGADVSVVNSVSKVKVLEADGTLSIKGMYWPGKGGIGANKDGTEDWENCPENSKIEWQQLRLGGDDYYRMYLTCGAPKVMTEPKCSDTMTCGDKELVMGSPVNDSCRCVPDCTKIYIDGQQSVWVEEGSLCCKPGQIVKRGSRGKYCTFVFAEESYYVNAIAPTISYKGSSPSTQYCTNLTSNACDAEGGYVCKPNYASVRYYKGGSVSRSTKTEQTCGSKCCGRCFASVDAHNTGWSGGTEITQPCPVVQKGEDVCDSLCDTASKTCDKYCIKYTVSDPPTLPNGSRYYSSSCRDSGTCCVWKDDCKFNSKSWPCAYTYSSYVPITHCKGVN